ncbi:g10253 [Coccomyxa elongata]
MLASDQCNRCTGLAFQSSRRYCLLNRRPCSKLLAANIKLGQADRHTICPQRWAQADTIEGEPTDYLITGIFAVVIMALAIVTIGVAYLSLSSFLDKRAEEEDKKKFEAAQRDRDLQALGINRPKRKRSSDEITRGGGKGFGS